MPDPRLLYLRIAISHPHLIPVTPAKAGGQSLPLARTGGRKGYTGCSWIPAFAGMTNDERGRRRKSCCKWPYRYWLRGQCRNTPAGCGSTRQIAFARRLLATAPASQNESSNAGPLGGELQSAARHIGQVTDLADDRGDTRAAQPLLHCPQKLGIARGPYHHQPRRVEPVHGQAEAIKIRPGEAPQHDPARLWRQPRNNAGGKSGGKRTILLIAARTEDFVQGAAHEPAARQGPVDRCDPKRQHAVRCCRWLLDPSNPFAKRQQKIVGH
jgi:hypothetical protein